MEDPRVTNDSRRVPFVPGSMMAIGMIFDADGFLPPLHRSLQPSRRGWGVEYYPSIPLQTLSSFSNCTLSLRVGLVHDCDIRTFPVCTRLPKASIANRCIPTSTRRCTTLNFINSACAPIIKKLPFFSSAAFLSFLYGSVRRTGIGSRQEVHIRLSALHGIPKRMYGWGTVSRQSRKGKPGRVDIDQT